MIDILKVVDLAGKNGVISEFSPGVFLQVFLYLFEGVWYCSAWCVLKLFFAYQNEFFSDFCFHF